MIKRVCQYGAQLFVAFLLQALGTVWVQDSGSHVRGTKTKAASLGTTRAPRRVKVLFAKTFDETEWRLVASS